MEESIGVSIRSYTRRYLLKAAPFLYILRPGSVQTNRTTSTRYLDPLKVIETKNDSPQ